MIYYYSLFCILFFYIGYVDASIKKIPDAAVALCWLLLFFISPSIPKLSFLCIGIFGSLVLLNTWHYKKFGKPLMGWGDILILPVWSVIIISINYLFLLAAPIAFFVAHFNKKKQPLGAYLCIGFNFALFAYIIGLLLSKFTISI